MFKIKELDKDGRNKESQKINNQIEEAFNTFAKGLEDDEDPHSLEHSPMSWQDFRIFIKTLVQSRPFAARLLIVVRRVYAWRKCLREKQEHVE